MNSIQKQVSCCSSSIHYWNLNKDFPISNCVSIRPGLSEPQMTWLEQIFTIIKEFFNGYFIRNGEILSNSKYIHIFLLLVGWALTSPLWPASGPMHGLVDQPCPVYKKRADISQGSALLNSQPAFQPQATAHSPSFFN